MTTKIMVVDDEPAIGKLLTYQLRGFGYQVTYVQEGQTALRRFLLEQPDLVLLDVMMPHVSGWDICRQIRASSSVPVIMLTAKGSDPDVVTGLNAGADDYVTKPFGMAQLQARIEAVLRRTAAARATHERPRAGGPRDARAVAPSAVYPARAAALAAPAVPERRSPLDETKTLVAHPSLTVNMQLEPPMLSDIPAHRLGQRVREARLERGLTLHQVERMCNIRWEFLQAIEQENWSYLPRQQLRLVLKTYTSYLGLDLRELISRPAAASAQRWLPPLPLHFAAFTALVVVLVVVGIYLL